MMKNGKKAMNKGMQGLAVFAVLLLIFVLLYKLTGIYYGVNDDTSMQKLAAGTITGKPDGHLIFMTYPAGCIISGLFRFIPGIDWYGLFLVGCLFLSYFIIVSRVFLRSADKPRPIITVVIVSMLITAFLLIDSLLQFQFTLVAGVLGATALFCLTSSGDELKISDYLLAWFLLLLSAMVRVMVFYMVLPLAAAVSAGNVLRTVMLAEPVQWKPGIGGGIARILSKKIYLIRIIVISVAGILAFVSLLSVERTAYSSERWKEYSEYKHARSLIMDYYGWPSYEDNLEFWNSIDISREEYDCLNMYGILPDINSEKIIRIAEYAERKSNTDTTVSDRISGMFTLITNAIQSGKSRYDNILLLIMLLILIYYAVRSDNIKRLCIITAVLAQVAILLYLLYRGRFPVRINQIYDYQCILAILGLLVSGREMFAGKWKKILRFACLLTIMTLFVFESARIRIEIKDKQYNIRIFDKQISYIKRHTDRLYVIAPGTMRSGSRFLLRFHDNSPDNTLGTVGWSVYSPWMDVRYRELGLDQNSDLLLKDDIYMLTAEKKYADTMTAYFRSKDVIDTDYETVATYKQFTGQKLYTIKWTPKEESGYDQ